MKNKIFVSILFTLSLLFLTGCMLSKKPVSAEDFTQIAKDNGLTVVDVKEQFKDYDKITSALVAVSTGGWQIEHYVLATGADAKGMFNENKRYFEEEKTSMSKQSNMEVGKYNKYTLETSTLYMVSTRIDNTYLYVKVPVENKETVMTIISALGY